jgi:hypothetical protein
MTTELLEAIKDLTKEVRLLRENFSPELKKSEIMQRKKRQREALLRDAWNHEPPVDVV